MASEKAGLLRTAAEKLRAVATLDGLSEFLAACRDAEQRANAKGALMVKVTSTPPGGGGDRFDLVYRITRLDAQ